MLAKIGLEDEVATRLKMAIELFNEGFNEGETAVIGVKGSFGLICKLRAKPIPVAVDIREISDDEVVFTGVF